MLDCVRMRTQSNIISIILFSLDHKPRGGDLQQLVCGGDQGHGGELSQQGEVTSRCMKTQGSGGTIEGHHR